MHPDRNPNADQDKFKELTSAYNLLSNEKKRKEYDEYRSISGGSSDGASQNYGAGQNPFGQGFNPFGQGRPGGGPNGYRKEYRYYSKGKTPEEIRKEFEEFFRKAGGNWNRGQNFRNQGANFQGFDQFMKNFREQYEKERQRQQY